MRRPSDGGIQVFKRKFAMVLHQPIAFQLYLQAVVLPHDVLANNEIVRGAVAWTIGEIIKQYTIESRAFTFLLLQYNELLIDEAR